MSPMMVFFITLLGLAAFQRPGAGLVLILFRFLGSRLDCFYWSVSLFKLILLVCLIMCYVWSFWPAVRAWVILTTLCWALGWDISGLYFCVDIFKGSLYVFSLFSQTKRAVISKIHTPLNNTDKNIQHKTIVSANTVVLILFGVGGGGDTVLGRF
jgi:hypothetical protein